MNNKLYPYVVAYSEEDYSEVLYFNCWAEDESHAFDQFINETSNSKATIRSIKKTEE